MKDVSALVDPVRQGSRLALGRLLTQVENDTEEGRQALVRLFPFTGKAHLIGVTGAPGTGKSSLVNRMAYQYRHPADGASPGGLVSSLWIPPARLPVEQSWVTGCVCATWRATLAYSYALWLHVAHLEGWLRPHLRSWT